MSIPRCIGGVWQLEHLIGSGSFAVVWKAHHISSGAPAAVKEINTEKLNKKLQESLASEIAVLRQARHQNIVGLLDMIKEPGKMYLVLEYCGGGDLGQYLRRYSRMSEDIARYFLLQLAEGMKEMRVHNLIHRDLKPQNLLLSDSTAQPLLKIADFGFARDLQPQGLAETLCGSPLYMAPEILHYHKYDAKADLWSVGTILFELLTGKPPFNGANHIQLLQNIERGDARLPPALAATLSPAVGNLMHGLLRRNPIERISFEEFFSHPFLVDGPKPLGLPAMHLPVPPTSHAPSASHIANHAHPHRRAPSPLLANAEQAPGALLSPVNEQVPGLYSGQQRGQADSGGRQDGIAAGGQQQPHSQQDQEQRTQQQRTEQLLRQQQPGGEQKHGQNSHGAGAAAGIEISVPGSRSPSPHSIAAAAGMQQHSPALYLSPGGAAQESQHAGSSAAMDLAGDDGLDPEEYVVVSHSLSPASSLAALRQQPQGQQQHGTMPILRALLQPALMRHNAASQATAAAAAAAAAADAAAHAASQGYHKHTTTAHTASAPAFPSPPPQQPRTPPPPKPGTATSHTSTSAPAQSPSGNHPASYTVNDGCGGLTATAQIVKLPDHLDPAELLHRVILVLLEVIRTKVEAVAAAEDDLLLGGSMTQSQMGKRGGGRDAGIMQGGRESVQQFDNPDCGNVREQHDEDGGGLSPEAWQAQAELLALQLHCARLIDAALLSTTKEAAGESDTHSVDGQTTDPHTMQRQSSLQRQPSHHSTQQHQQQRSLLLTHAKASLALSDERMLSGSFQALLDSGMRGRLVPSGADMVYDSALRFGRSAAVDELMGAHRRGVEAYAKAADLLLFLLTEVPQVMAVKPSLDPVDHAQLYKYYAAVRMRQSYCMAELNAQHAR